jgi:ribose/xylose/arabinose/galactoside ABC-type transport system permease subunit
MVNALTSTWRTLLDRLREPSTFAGLAALAMLVGVTGKQFDLGVDAITHAANAVAAILALVAMFKREQGNPRSDRL